MEKLLLIACFFLKFYASNADTNQLFCYYDSKSFNREAQAKMLPSDLDPALPFCTHLLYGYAGIDHNKNKMVSLNENLDLDQGHANYRMITQLKRRYPNIKVLLSVGGGADPEEEGIYKYNTILETPMARTTFINSAKLILKNYGFDGLDLAWQFPTVRPKKIRGGLGSFWNSFKKVSSPVNEHAEEHTEQSTKLVDDETRVPIKPLKCPTENQWVRCRPIACAESCFPEENPITKTNMSSNQRSPRQTSEPSNNHKEEVTGEQEQEDYKEQFAKLVQEIKKILRYDKMLLTVSVLPNVNTSAYFDIPGIMNNLDYVILHGYDYNTPKRNPKEADYASPIYELLERKPDRNIHFHVNYWIKNGFPANKLILGVPTFGRAWKMDLDSATSGIPPIHIDGPAPEGSYTKHEGLLSYPEICAQLSNPTNPKSFPNNFMRKVTDPSKRYGTYAFRLPDDKGDNGIWVSFDDLRSAANKASYAKAKNLGGLAVVDLSLDDFRGVCTGDKYPILRAIKFILD